MLDTVLGTVVQELTSRVASALATTPAGSPGRSCAVAGTLAWDDCQCGLLAVTIDHMYPSVIFPEPAGDLDLVRPCPPPYLAVDLTVTVLRCAPVPASDGLGPSCDALSAAALDWVWDVDAVAGAVACTVTALLAADTIADFTIHEQSAAGPDGGCVGSGTRLTVGVPACGCVGG